MEQQQHAPAGARAVFDRALEIASPPEREAYVARSCGGDASLRRQVDALLYAYAQAGSFLESPAPEFCTAATLNQPLREGPGSLIGRYKLLQQIGEGGFGVVFMAEQEHPVRRRVALKVIKLGMDTRQVVARFEAERQALAMMDHPNIAKVLDGGATDTGLPYFVMELVTGIPITEFCNANQLTTRQRLELFVQVCRAVQHAHTKGIIHRDLKPSNVLVTMHDDKPVPKVIDFGIAKATQSRLTERTLFTEFKQFVGTPQYTSPEQAQMSGLDVDTRSDVYSLGVLLYELLTGSTPLDPGALRAAGFDAMRRMIREAEPPRPSTRLSTLGQALVTIAAQRRADPKRLPQLVRGELDWIVMKCLEKDRTRRYETASGLAADVWRHLRDEPVQACPPSAAYRFRKFARRNKAPLAVAAATAVVLVLAVAGLAVSNVLIARQKNQKNQALTQARTNEQAANQQRHEAQENLRDALAAVDQMLTRLSEERLQFVPQTEAVRRDLLQDALKFYEKFLARRGDDPSVRRETALAHRRVGFLQYQLGDYGRSEAAFRQAFAMFDELDAQSPLDAGMRSEMVFACIEYSLVLDNQAKNEDRERALRRAVALAESLVAQFPDAAAYRDQLVNTSNRLADAVARRDPVEAERVLRRNLAVVEKSADVWLRGQTWLNLAGLLARVRRHDEAESASHEAIKLFEKAVAQAPSVPWMHTGLTAALEQLAAAVEAQGRPGEAAEAFGRVIGILDRLAADYPSGPHYRWGLATACLKHASLLKGLHRPAEAERAFRRSIELTDKLSVDFPNLPGYRWTAAARRAPFAEYLLERGRVQEAKQLVEAVALESLDVPDRPKALTLRGHFYGAVGEWDKAAADFSKAVELGSQNVLGAWYPLAVLHLRAGRTAEYRSLCERVLREPGLAEQRFAVVICKLAPNAVADLSRPVRIAERLVARDASEEHVGLLGAALYRQGDLEHAVQRLEEASRAGSQELGSPWRGVVLAMAYHRSGRPAEARKLFQQATRWMEENSREQLTEGAALSGPGLWPHRLDLQMLHREAEELLKEKKRE